MDKSRDTTHFQTSFLPNEITQITNVASVRQRSPFRYPGGKTWLIPKIRLWLESKLTRPSHFVEPFAGGGIVGITVAAENLADHIDMAELDSLVAAVWKTIIHDDGGAEWLSEKIIAFDMKTDNVKAVLAETCSTTRDIAFQAIIKNRVNRGGIMANGAGLLKEGEAGKGLKSRWYPDTLKKRILDIASFRDRITFVHGDGFKIIKNYSTFENIAFFIDPPYTASQKRAGSRLYTNSDIDHEELFSIVAHLEGDFLMSYDNSEEVRTLAERHAFDVQAIAMKNTHHAKMTELLIGRNLSWLRG